MSVLIKRIPKGPLTENTYVLSDEISGEIAVVDPGYFEESLIDSNVKYILLTHGHGDHIYEVMRYKESFPEAQVVACEDEEELLSHAMFNGSLGMNKEITVDADLYLKDGDELYLGEFIIKCIATPGHSRGGMCYLVDNNLFSGDTLFRLSVGNTGFHGGSWEVLQESIRNKLYVLDDDVKVYPGHGFETSIGFEKVNNPYVQVLSK